MHSLIKYKIIILLFFLSQSLTSQERYYIYNPFIHTTTIYKGINQKGNYNHTSSIASFKDSLYVVWATNDNSPNEGSIGQKIVLSISNDNGITWTDPISPFNKISNNKGKAVSENLHCHNPVTSSSTQFQPNLIVYNDKLYCFWIQGRSKIRYRKETFETATMMSILSEPSGKWINHRLEFNYETEKIYFNSKCSTGVLEYGISPTGNNLFYDKNQYLLYPNHATIFSKNRLIIAATLYKVNHPPHIHKWYNKPWNETEKLNILLLTNNGINWNLEKINSFKEAKYKDVWEPIISESINNQYYLFSRNLKDDLLNISEQSPIIFSKSDDLKNWTPYQKLAYDIPNSNGFIKKISKSRWVFIHNDYRQITNKEKSIMARQNISLFFSTRGSTDYIPGINISQNNGLLVNQNERISYPKLTLHNNKIFSTFTKRLYDPNMNQIGYDICLSIIGNIPENNKIYIYPRQFAKHMINRAHYSVINIKKNHLFLFGNSSAGIETKHNEFQIKLRYKLGILMTANEKSILLTIGGKIYSSNNKFIKLYIIKEKDQYLLYANNLRIKKLKTPYKFNTIIFKINYNKNELHIENKVIKINQFKRIFLGDAYLENKTSIKQFIQFDINNCMYLKK